MPPSDISTTLPGGTCNQPECKSSSLDSGKNEVVLIVDSDNGMCVTVGKMREMTTGKMGC